MRRDGEACCKDCVYYEPGYDDVFRHEGYCRINPPRLVPLKGRDPSYGQWPRVTESDWCGKGKTE